MHFPRQLKRSLRVHGMVSLNSLTNQQHKPKKKKQCVAFLLLRPCDLRWCFPTIFTCSSLCVDKLMYPRSQGVFSVGLPKDCRVDVIPYYAVDGRCYFLLRSGCSLLFPRVLWMVGVVSWCAPDGRCNFWMAVVVSHPNAAIPRLPGADFLITLCPDTHSPYGRPALRPTSRNTQVPMGGISYRPLS